MNPDYIGSSDLGDSCDVTFMPTNFDYTCVQRKPLLISLSSPLVTRLQAATHHLPSQGQIFYPYSYEGCSILKVP